MGEVVKVDQNHPDPHVIDRAARVLEEGGVVVLPTDSVYGISCAAREGNPGHERIFRIKRRDRSLTLPWLVASTDDLLRYGTDVPSWVPRLAAAFWPGALTIVVSASDEVPPEYRRADGTIALRMPDSVLVRELADRVATPLATTSANLHGLPAVGTAKDLDSRLVADADLTLDGGELPLGVASTIVDGTAASPRILREGPLSAEAIEEAIHDHGGAKR
jgi:tRNA threonylcarbamoyl adenosine modification protein (Sua5/YciO/YrdC/YwlC family)